MHIMDLVMVVILIQMINMCMNQNTRVICDLSHFSSSVSGPSEKHAKNSGKKDTDAEDTRKLYVFHS